MGVSTHLNRSQMETLADLWQLSEQLRLRVELSCDAAMLGAGLCRGWDELSDGELRKACLELSKSSDEEQGAQAARTISSDAPASIGILTRTRCFGVA
jgi:hypothetical protein